MRFDVLTLFPEMVEGPLSASILGRALKANAFELGVKQIRDHGIGRHRTVDDSPFGGGSGMVMRVDVVDAAISAVRRPDSHVVLLEASGRRFDQAMAARFATLPHLVLICGHYEGVDARVREHLVDETISIGDFVLTGGEYAALVVVDATARLLPGVLGNAESLSQESYSAGGGLEYPHYTRPRSYRGWDVPEILLSGDHGRVDRWRREQAEVRTRSLRPDLLDPPVSVDDRDSSD
jgi:tRNA (guanine37-N1)-methyltransferase